MEFEGAESEDSAFCTTGALTIRSSNSSCSNSSAGGLAGMLGVSCDASLSSNEDSSLDRNELDRDRDDGFHRPMLPHHQGVDPNELVAQISKIGLKQPSSGETIHDYVSHLQQQQQPQQASLHVGWNLGANLHIYPTDPAVGQPPPTATHPPHPPIGYTSTVHPLEENDLAKGHQGSEVKEEEAGQPFRDLRELLGSLGLTKYLHVFEEQEIDLRVFLTLTDSDLKEVGIK